jgi:hypothetical protein
MQARERPRFGSTAVDSTVESKWLGLGSGKSLPDYFWVTSSPDYKKVHD